MTAHGELFMRAAVRLWPALLDHLWQATLLAAVVYVLTLLFKRGPARLRHTLWLVAYAKLAVPTALCTFASGRLGLGLSWGVSATRGAPLVEHFAAPLQAQAPLVDNNLAGTIAQRGELFCLLTLVWLAGCALLLLVWLSQRCEFARSVRAGREVLAGREFDALSSARARLGLRRAVALVLTRQRIGPGVWRTRRPVVVLPELIAEHLDDDELEALMLHEVAHVVRHDNLCGNLQRALACVFWFDPVVWLMHRQLMQEREQACDERVLEAGGRACVYAASILKVVRFSTGWRLAGLAGASAGSNLRRRIETILSDNKGRQLARWQSALAPALLASMLALTAWLGLTSQTQNIRAHAQDGAHTQGSRLIVVREGDGETIERASVRANAPPFNDAMRRESQTPRSRTSEPTASPSVSKSIVPAQLPDTETANTSGFGGSGVGLGYGRGYGIGRGGSTSTSVSVSASTPASISTSFSASCSSSTSNEAGLNTSTRVTICASARVSRGGAPAVAGPAQSQAN